MRPPLFLKCRTAAVSRGQLMGKQALPCLRQAHCSSDLHRDLEPRFLMERFPRGPDKS
jgi:hypothetical protein